MFSWEIVLSHLVSHGSFCLLACLRRQISVRPLVRTVAVAVLLPSLLGFPHNRHQDFLTIATKISSQSPPRFPCNRHQDFLTIATKISSQLPPRFPHNRHQNFLTIDTKILFRRNARGNAFLNQCIFPICPNFHFDPTSESTRIPREFHVGI